MIRAGKLRGGKSTPDRAPAGDLHEVRRLKVRWAQAVVSQTLADEALRQARSALRMQIAETCEAKARAELEVARRLRLAEELEYATRPWIQKKLLRRNGRPVRLIRQLFFRAAGKPRRLSRWLVLNREGQPRSFFTKWMNSDAYQSKPEAAGPRRAVNKQLTPRGMELLARMAPLDETEGGDPLDDLYPQ